MNKLILNYERSHLPLYAQVAFVMRQRIESGDWREGDKISTIEELESEFGVARNTIRQAVETLRREGLLASYQGRGTFVSGRPKNRERLNLGSGFETVIDSIKSNVLKRLYIENSVAPPKLAAHEGEPSEGYAFLRSVQYNNDEPFSVVNLYLAREIFLKDCKRFAHTAALAKIMEMDDIEIIHAHQIVTIGVADPETAELLKIGLGEPTADCRLVLVDGRNTAIYVANIHYHRNYFALRVDLPEKINKRLKA
jgi:GntR family transcriptional regulator